MDMKSQIEKMKSPLQELLEAVQNLSEHVDKMESTKTTPEPKEPETWEQLQQQANTHIHAISVELIVTSSEQQKQVTDFYKRLLIADYCGRRDYIENEDNWGVWSWHGNYEIVTMNSITLGDNLFPTKEAAEKYLKICLNSNLL